MPSPFDITVATNTVSLDNNRQGVAVFTVKNNTRRHIHATAQVSTQPPDGAKWLTILPPGSGTDTASGRDFAIDATQQYQVQIAAPMDAAPASYTLKLTVADDVNPDDNFTVSPDVVFTVRDVPKPQPRPFPVWIIPAVIVVLIVIVAIIVIGINAANTANANATGTAVALANARDIADTATANALLNATATANAALTATQNAVGTQNALATQIALGTQTALNVFVGSWVPDDSSNSGTVGSMSIADAGSNRVNITFTSNCSPGGTLCNATAATYQINGVPFDPQRLAATLQNETFLIQPTNGGKLAVAISVSLFTSTVTLKRSLNRFQQIGVLQDFQFQQASQLQLNQMLATSSP